jgi:hypothetical protein
VLAKNVFSSQNDSKFLKTLFIISIIFGFCTSVGGGILAWKELNQRTESANLKQLEKKINRLKIVQKSKELSKKEKKLLKTLETAYKEGIKDKDKIEKFNNTPMWRKLIKLALIIFFSFSLTSLIICLCLLAIFGKFMRKVSILSIFKK